PRVPIPARPSTNTVGVDPTQAGQSAEAGQAVQGGPSNPGLNRTRALRFPMTPPLPRVRPLPVAGPDEPPASRAGVPSYPNRPDHRDQRDHTSHPEYPDYHAERRVRRRRGVIVLVAVLLLGAGAAGAGWSYGILHYTKVPVLKGMTRGAAVGIAHESHLRVRSTTSAVFDDIVKAGLVAGSSPGQGNRITRGGELTLLISKGPGPRTIPNLSGRSADEALRTLADLKLTGKVAPVFGDVDAGSVAATAPRSGSTVAIGSTVTVLVSKGRLPDTTGDTRDNAVRQLRDAGLKVRVTEEFTDEAARGKVASQQPSGGIVRPGATVTLVVSKGAESVRVPNVIGRDLDDARAQLEKLGFKVKVNLVLGGRSGRVVTQTPVGGFSQHRGAIIHLGVI
ncbi:MAG TPA: PASTA domain-containing protein, partial [Mycobacteriales bacterium]